MNKQWMDMNNEFLAQTLEWIRLLLQRAALPPANDEKKAVKPSKGSWFNRKKDAGNELPSRPSASGLDDEIARFGRKITEFKQNDSPPALVVLADLLGLSEFDCSVLMLCAGMELDTRIAALCAQAQGDPNKPYPTFALAFTLFNDPDWGALSPHAALRHWRLLEVSKTGTQPLTGAALKADEKIVNYLKGLNYLDDRLTPLLDPVRVNDHEQEELDLAPPPSQQQVVKKVINFIKHADKSNGMPVIELLGFESEIKREIAGRTVSALGLNLYGIDTRSLPIQVEDFELFSRLWRRESLLMPLAVYINASGRENPEDNRLNRFLEQVVGLVFLDLEETAAIATRQRFSIEVAKPTPEEQQQLWAEALMGSESAQSQQLAEQFSFTQGEIRRLAASIEGGEQEGSTSSVPPLSADEKLWQACRVAARTGMEKLATRIDAKATWQQLVLPREQKSLLHQISAQVSCRNRVYETWGFREQMNRGLGINALFAGESGVGKTMAAEVIANDLQLDLYRIDLSGVVSKYIGETEKNLRRLFDAAEDSGAILFFDEADALFGKRSEVKDSHDRYANIEINYLLQRMESYRGLAILATNMKSALDKAFVRRLRFIIDFPYPGVAERTEIWQKIFPPDTPLDQGFDYQHLARLSLTGGNIHNVAVNAAFLAAENDGPVTMPLVLEAARAEFRKLERPAKDTDFSWESNIEAVS